ncbi:MAG: acylphosphatase [Candidatus Kapabacteria bacterium]|nr:acylphosphatase [Candidatus Kapabacteria bacterium]
MDDLISAEFIVSGLVQGVGFRYFVYRNATALGLNGYVKNLNNGNVLTVVEGRKDLVEELYERLKIGPMRAYVKSVSQKILTYQGIYDSFEIR